MSKRAFERLALFDFCTKTFFSLTGRVGEEEGKEERGAAVPLQYLAML
jgi:hypothetical protein